MPTAEPSNPKPSPVGKGALTNAKHSRSNGLSSYSADLDLCVKHGRDRVPVGCVCGSEDRALNPLIKCTAIISRCLAVRPEGGHVRDARTVNDDVDVDIDRCARCRTGRESHLGQLSTRRHLRWNDSVCGSGRRSGAGTPGDNQRGDASRRYAAKVCHLCHPMDGESVSGDSLQLLYCSDGFTTPGAPGAQTRSRSILRPQRTRRV
jgi:hypothetical protein